MSEATQGSVVDIRFDKHLRPIYSVLRAGTDQKGVAEVLTQRDSRHVRGIALTPTQGLARGMAVEDTGGPLKAPVGKGLLSRMFDVFGNTIDRGAVLSDVPWRSVHRAPPPLARHSTKSEIFETGIKVIGVLVPLERGGKAGLFGGAGVGKTVLLTEIIDNIFRFIQGGMEVSGLMGQMPSRLGYQPTIGTELSGLEERIANTDTGAITSIQAVYVPADDFTDPAAGIRSRISPHRSCSHASGPAKGFSRPSTHSNPVPRWRRQALSAKGITSWRRKSGGRSRNIRNSRISLPCSAWSSFRRRTATSSSVSAGWPWMKGCWSRPARTHSFPCTGPSAERTSRNSAARWKRSF